PDIFVEIFVLSNGDMSEVKRDLELIFGDDKSAVRPQSVPHAEFVERPGIRGRQVSDDHVCRQNLLVHRNVYDTRVHDLIGTVALQPGLFHRRLDHVPVGGVEVEFAPRLKIDLFAEPHDHEAGRLTLRLRFDRHGVDLTGLHGISTAVKETNLSTFSHCQTYELLAVKLADAGASLTVLVPAGLNQQGLRVGNQKRYRKGIGSLGRRLTLVAGDFQDPFDKFEAETDIIVRLALDKRGPFTPSKRVGG